MPRKNIIPDHKASQRSKPSYTRPPIHHKTENEETTDEEVEEEDEEDCLNRPKVKTLYPDLKEDLSILQNQANQAKFSRSEKYKSYKQQFTSKKSDSDANSSSVFKYIIYALVILATSILAFFFSYGSKNSSYQINVPELMDEMQNQFKGQHSHTFKLLKLALTKVVTDEPEPTAPAIFTVVANKGAEKTASDFSIYLANALAPGQFVSINESVQFRSDPDNLKFIIDKKIRSNLEENVLNAVIVDRLNDVPIGAAQIFHGFCDHESAPYKRVVYLFIVHLDKRIPENESVRNIDEVAIKSIRNIWLTSTDDYVDSLITRLTVNVVNIK